MENTTLSHHGIRGMKWGVRRYQNVDGSLTAVGKKRYNQDIRNNLSKKKENRFDTSNPDPNRWVKEDLERRKKIVDVSSDMVRQIKSIERDTRPKIKTSRMDLSKMTDKEMRDRINRELLEQQYNKLFAEETTPTISKGRQYTQAALEAGGAVLGITGSALGIALAIKELKS